MEPAWSIREYKNGDEVGILELRQAVYGEIVDREQWFNWWKWMYNDNPAGRGRIWLAEHSGKIVGQYAIVPRVMKIAGEIITGALSLDTMTHPDYRREGIFESLAKRVYSQAAEEDIYVIYGFPNKFSYPGFIKKLNWFDICSIRTLMKVLHSENVMRAKLRVRFVAGFLSPVVDLMFKTTSKARGISSLRSVTITKVSSFDDRINNLWEHIAEEHNVAIVRNKEYLNWRYAEVPDVKYTIYLAEVSGEVWGYIVLRCIETEDIKSGFILDLVTPLNQEGIIQSLVSTAIEYFKQEKADIIYCRMLGDRKYYKVFKENGFIYSLFRLRSRFAAYSDKQALQIYLKNPKYWFIQIGDSDFL